VSDVLDGWHGRCFLGGFCCKPIKKNGRFAGEKNWGGGLTAQKRNNDKVKKTRSLGEPKDPHYQAHLPKDRGGILKEKEERLDPDKSELNRGG